MNPLPSLVVAVALCLTGARPVQAQTTSSPVEALTKKLAEDPTARADAGARVEAFLLSPDSAGRSFVSADADRAALSVVARGWAGHEDPRRLAALVFLSAPGSAGEARLRTALEAWTGSAQIRREGERSGAVAFLADAADKASRVLEDPRARREIDAAIEANDRVAPAVPGTRESIERARLLRERRGSGNTAVFGPDRAAQDLNAGGDRTRAIAGGNPPGGTASGSPGAGPRVVPGKVGPAAQLPRSQGRPDNIRVPAPGAGGHASATSSGGGQTGESGASGVPNDGRVVPTRPLGAWERIKDSVRNPLSDAYGFTFEGLEPQPVSFRQHVPALAYASKAKPASFSKVTFYGHGAPGYMTVGEWGGDAGDIASILKGRMRAGATVEIKGCNTSSIGGASVNPGRGISGLTRRVLYFSFPYLTGDRSESSREQLENDWDSDLARDTSRGLPGVKVCGFRTFGLVGDRVPVVGSLLGRREATDSNAILGSKACFVDGKEVGS